MQAEQIIGINLSKKLLKNNSQVLIIDNLSNAYNKEFNNLKNIKYFLRMIYQFRINTDFKNINKNYNSEVTVWHLAANSNIPAGIINPNIDLKDTFKTTFCLIEACKEYDIKNFVFASSSAIYGNFNNFLIKESTGPLRPISNYGAMKLASEAICFAAAEKYLKNLRIFRFPSCCLSTHELYDFIIN